MKKISFYFPAGDFYEALNRFDKGQPQYYQTHDEVARLINELSDLQIQITIFSTVTPERQERLYGDRIKIIDLGENDFLSTGRLVKSIQEIPADVIIAHHANSKLLKASLNTKSRIFPILAATDNRTGMRAWVRRRERVHILNNPRFDLVANHCMPATRQLASFGVRKEKLVAWDIAHPFHPDLRPAKALRERGPFQIFYAGSISEAKGVADVIRALPLVLSAGADARCVLAGGGTLDSMRKLAGLLGVEDRVTFIGMIPNSEVQERMAGADIVAIPSRTEFPEGFPLTMFEAIASRTPIICSDHPVFSDPFVDGRDVAMFRGGDSASLARAMIGLLNDNELYHRLSLNAEAAWGRLHGPADWRTLLKTWIFEGAQAPWIQQHVLSNAL
jgi:glycosyltransferase involved in cell wall biosynthesis